MPTIAPPCQAPASGSTRRSLPPVYHHLYSLLHTLRQLGSQQDHLCTLLADIQRTGKLSVTTRRELTALLHDLPIMSLDAELRTVAAELAG